MLSFKITIEDTSPIISYSPDWRAGHSSDDGMMTSYSQSSFTVTNVKGASLSFTFNGTGIEIFGARRLNHGMYQVKMDDALQPPSNGSVADPGTFQLPLFSASNLAQGLHTVILTNLDGSYLDIDYITWDTTIGNKPDDKLHVITYQDTSPSFTYLPSEADWAVPLNNLGSFMGGSGHATTKAGASLKYSFEGDGVSLYGPVGPEGSSYVVDVDGGPSRTFTAKKEFYIPQSLLYHASSLGPGTHNVTLSYQQDPLQQTLAIDYAAVYTTAETRSSNNTGPTGQVSTGGKSTRQPIGLIVGLTVSVAILLIISGVMSTLFWRERKQKKQGRIPFNVNPSLGDPMAATIQIPHPPPPTTETTLPSNRYTYRFQKSRTTEASTSRTPLISSSASTSQVSSSVVYPASRGENPPEYSVQ